MNPKNNFQKQIIEEAIKLPKITNEQLQWAYKHCFEHYGKLTKKGVITCLECGHSWTDKNISKKCNCPNCNTKLKIEQTAKRVFNDFQYLCIVTTCKDYQVLRYFYIRYDVKAGGKARYFHSEVVQRWIAPNGKCATVARLRPVFGYTQTWSFASYLEIRPEKNMYNIIPTRIYPRIKLTKELKRAGLKRNFYKLTPFNLCHFLLNENKAETLLKTKQIDLLKHFTLNRYNDINSYWASIRICIRNNYIVKDGTLWCDYIDLLRYFGKDLHNSKYICPADLKMMHDIYMRKKQDKLEYERKQREILKALKDENTFIEQKSKFFGLQFTDGLIEIKMLESVHEVMTEGKTLHHCVFTNNYHIKPDSLILSARIDGSPVETIEISLTDLQVLQCRGVCNEISKYHKRILKLVNKNKSLIQQRIAA